MRRYIVYNGHRSDEFGIVVDGFSVLNAPQRIVRAYSIPGRSGDVVIDDGTYANATISYNMAAFRVPRCEGLDRRIAEIKSWLMADGGYHRLDDGYDNGSYRLARYIGGFEPTLIGSSYRNFGFEAVFDAMPQRFLTIGDNPIALEAEEEKTIFNPTAFDALPMIIVTNATEDDDIVIKINGREAVALSQITIGDSYRIDLLNLDAVGISGGAEYALDAYLDISRDYRLHAGANTIEINHDAQIIPRWWRL